MAGVGGYVWKDDGNQRQLREKMGSFLHIQFDYPCVALMFPFGNLLAKLS